MPGGCSEGPPFDLPWRPARQREEKLWRSVCPWVPRSRELKFKAQQVRGGSPRGVAPGSRIWDLEGSSGLT